MICICICGHSNKDHLYLIDRDDIYPCRKCYEIRHSMWEFKIGRYDVVNRKYPLCTKFTPDNLFYLEQKYMEKLTSK